MAYVLGVSSRAHLAGVHPALIAVVEEAIKLTSQDFTVMQGLRSIDEERQHVADGTSRTMHSMHLRQADGYGHAVDLVPWVAGRAQWLWPHIYPITKAMQEAAVGLGTRIRWGGCWDRILNDLPAGCDFEAEMRAYEARHAGSDLLDGPHYELHA